MSNNKLTIYDMFQKGLSVKDISAARTLRARTVVHSLAECLANGMKLDLARLGIREEDRKEVNAAMSPALNHMLTALGTQVVLKLVPEGATVQDKRVEEDWNATVRLLRRSVREEIDENKCAILLAEHLRHLNPPDLEEVELPVPPEPAAKEAKEEVAPPTERPPLFLLQDNDVPSLSRVRKRANWGGSVGVGPSEELRPQQTTQQAQSPLPTAEAPQRKVRKRGVMQEEVEILQAPPSALSALPPSAPPSFLPPPSVLPSRPLLPAPAAVAPQAACTNTIATFATADPATLTPFFACADPSLEVVDDEDMADLPSLADLDETQNDDGVWEELDLESSIEQELLTREQFCHDIAVVDTPKNHAATFDTFDS